MNGEKFVLSLLVNNEAGVLTRVSGLFSRRGFNIDSLSVEETEDTHISRITITGTGDEYVKEQIVKQLEKLHDVKAVELMDLEKTVLRELLLIKIRAQKGEYSEVMQAVSVFRAKVIDLNTKSLTLELTGDPPKINAFIQFLKPYGIVELCRTGVTAIGRGDYIVSEKTQNLGGNNNG